MSETRKHAPSEREGTDRSLSDERRKTDEELAQRTSKLDQDAEAVVATARRLADEVLARARAVADAKIDGADLAERGRVADERQRDDAVLRRERAVADEELLKDQETHSRVLLALLAVERSRTDESLLLERRRMDELIGSRDEFLGMVTHDLRNLLTIVAMSASMLLRIEAEPVVRSGIAREANRIWRAAAQMTRLVGDLLDVVSMETGHLDVSPDRHDAADLVRETADVFRPWRAARGSRSRVTCELAPCWRVTITNAFFKSSPTSSEMRSSSQARAAGSSSS